MPTLIPTPFAGNSFQCQHYATIGLNWVNCYFVASGGSVLTISGCGACSGDQYLQLLDEAGSIVLGVDDDGCGVFKGCSMISYSIPASKGYKIYTVQQGCWDTPCDGNVTINGIITGLIFFNLASCDMHSYLYYCKSANNITYNSTIF